MPWGTLALLGVLALWGLVALVPWYAAAIATRGRIGLATLPVVFAAGAAGGALVPALGGSDALGFAISLLAAFLAGTAVSALALRRANAARKESR
jgi:hypothetical protein